MQSVYRELYKNERSVEDRRWRRNDMLSKTCFIAEHWVGEREENIMASNEMNFEYK